MKKAVATLLVILLTFSLFSCKEKDREYDEEEVISAAGLLIYDSVILNEIYWGKGIDYINNASTSNGYYYEANVLHLEKLGFDTIDELKKKTEKVFSDSFSSIIYETTLTSVSDDDGIYSLARYYQKYADEEMKEPEAIMVYSKAKVLLSDEVEYLYDTITVDGAKGEIVYVTISVIVTRDQKSQTRSITVGLIEEEDGWRLNDATYISFDEGLSEN